MNESINIFELLHDRFQLSQKPRLFEAFAGIGCQRMAFNRLGIEVEVVGISEIDKYAIKSYMAIHGDTKNFGDITKIKGNELPQIDCFTYSFPCTDLSRAGKMKGMNEETRSGLLYQVIRILREMQSVNNLPRVLIMENVSDLVQNRFIRQFNEVQAVLEKMGYKNYVRLLNAKDFGIAQNRDRAFMVSVLGDFYYEFPKPIPLMTRLRDYLESVVDQKYYLSERLLDFFKRNTEKSKGCGNGFKFKPHDHYGDDIAFAITTKAGSRMDDNFVIDSIRIGGVFDNEDGKHQAGSVWDKDGLCPTLDTMQGGYRQPMIEEIGVETRVRRLTPRECWRLMGIDDESFDRASEVCSDTQLYKQAGNGIVVDVFASLISTMFDGGNNGKE